MKYIEIDGKKVEVESCKDCPCYEDVDYYADLLDKAKRGGYNGLLFAGNLENAFTWPEERKALFSKVKKLCDDSGIELIPLVWSPGYGSFCGLDRDLYEVEP